MQGYNPEFPRARCGLREQPFGPADRAFGEGLSRERLVLEREGFVGGAQGEDVEAGGIAEPV